MKIIFAGTPEFAATALAALIASEHEIVAVYTQPDRPAGRGRKLRPSAVKVLAENAGLDVYQPLSLKDEAVAGQLAIHQADIMVVVAYGLILPASVLKVPRLGCVNIHASMLPRWRGAAPIQRAILTGDSTTGITIIQMDAGLDTGSMIYRLACKIEARETGATLHDKLAELGAQAILKALDALQNDTVTSEKQDDALACYAAKLNKEEAWLDWRASALDLDRKIRAFNAWPIARSYWQGQMVMIWRAEVLGTVSAGQADVGSVLAVSDQGIDVAAGEGVLRLQTVQFPGGKPLAVRDILKSKPISVGDLFSSYAPEAAHEE